MSKVFKATEEDWDVLSQYVVPAPWWAAKEWVLYSPEGKRPVSWFPV